MRPSGSLHPLHPRSLRRMLLALVPVFLCYLLLVNGSELAGQSLSAHGLAVPLLATPTPQWPNDGATDHSIISAGCGRADPVSPGATAEQSVAVNPGTNEGFSSRTYWIHVPQGYTPSRPTALVLVFHGGGGTGSGAAASSGWSPFADRHNILAVYPQGLPFTALGPGYTSWAATGPLDTLANGVDDLLFVSNLLDALQRLYCVDPQRIYATGFSAGGGMTSFLTCGLTGRIAAFAPMSGDAYQFQGGCYPPHPTSIIEFHGAADPSELYAGIPAREDPDWRRIGVMEWLTTWAARDRCATGPNTFIQEALVLAQQWTGCRDGTAIVHYRITGLGHSGPPPIDGRSALDIIWSFFQTHPLPTT